MRKSLNPLLSEVEIEDKIILFKFEVCNHYYRYGETINTEKRKQKKENIA